ncbi:BolA/IbaG family iron-sulfur metabolism protein [Marinomonas sp. 2405UD68-3]|uniref:BolA/IbaG family iron-sulfur metabolism protein n=1 Tax=Marinomonas sp. 2405UD68-3 TaxID=3391835 RepID=UPI0039C9E4D8
MSDVIKNEILAVLDRCFDCEYILLENESYKHNVPEGSESHFKLVLVSNDFEGKRLVQRHQAIYKSLVSVMPKFHALAMHLHTSKEWGIKNNAVPESPNCLGGE